MPGDGVGPGSGCRIRSAVSEQGLKASVVIGKERAARTINSLVPEQPFQKWTKTYNAWWVLSPMSPLLCGTGPIYPAQIRILGLCKWFRTHLCPEGEFAKLHSFKFSLLLTVYTCSSLCWACHLCAPLFTWSPQSMAEAVEFREETENKNIKEHREEHRGEGSV